MVENNEQFIIKDFVGFVKCQKWNVTTILHDFLVLQNVKNAADLAYDGSRGGPAAETSWDRKSSGFVASGGSRGGHPAEASWDRKSSRICGLGRCGFIMVVPGAAAESAGHGLVRNIIPQLLNQPLTC